MRNFAVNRRFRIVKQKASTTYVVMEACVLYEIVPSWATTMFLLWMMSSVS